MGSSESIGGREICSPRGTFREIKRPHRFLRYVAAMSHINYSKPSCYEEESNQLVWRDAIMEEYWSIMKNDVWDIVLRPKGKSVVTSKRIYNIKHPAKRSIKKHKARFVARGFSYLEGIYYDETFAPITRYTYIQMIISLSSTLGWRLLKMEMKTTYLNGDI
jgi:hypothetical protein